MRGPIRHDEPYLPSPHGPRGPDAQSAAFRAALGLPEAGPPVVLFALHNPPVPDWTGGTEGHATDLAAALEGWEVVWLYARPDHFALVAGRAPHRELLRVPLFPPQSSDQVFHHGFACHLRTILVQLQVRLVHVHHLMNLPADVLAVPQTLGIPVIFTAHDYFTVCPQFNLVDYRRVYCAGNLEGPRSRCEACMSERMGMGAETLFGWRRALAELLPTVTRLVAPSRVALEPIDACYPGIAERTQVIPHGLDTAAPARRRPPAPAVPLTVAFAGTLTIPKGAELLARILASPRATAFRWKVLGQGGFQRRWLDALPAGLVLDWCGPYASGSLPRRLVDEGVDVLIFPAIWPETFSYVVSEAFAAGVPILATDLGAPAERVREAGAGWIFDAGRPDSALDRLELLERDRAEVARRSERAAAVRLRSTREMAADYRALYDRTAAPRSATEDPAALESRTLELLYLAGKPQAGPEAAVHVPPAPDERGAIERLLVAAGRRALRLARALDSRARRAAARLRGG